MSTEDIKTVTVPYIPPTDEDVLPPKWFADNIKAFGKDMPDIKDFELHEIQGTRLVYFEDTDEWTDLGHVAIYRRKP